jgi:hypothetical protein
MVGSSTHGNDPSGTTKFLTGSLERPNKWNLGIDCTIIRKQVLNMVRESGLD